MSHRQSEWGPEKGRDIKRERGREGGRERCRRCGLGREGTKKDSWRRGGDGFECMWQGRERDTERERERENPTKTNILIFQKKLQIHVDCR